MGPHQGSLCLMEGSSLLSYSEDPSFLSKVLPRRLSYLWLAENEGKEKKEGWKQLSCRDTPSSPKVGCYRRFYSIVPPQVDRIWLWAIYLRGTINLFRRTLNHLRSPSGMAPFASVQLPRLKLKGLGFRVTLNPKPLNP